MLSGSAITWAEFARHPEARLIGILMRADGAETKTLPQRPRIANSHQCQLLPACLLSFFREAIHQVSGQLLSTEGWRHGHIMHMQHIAYRRQFPVSSMQKGRGGIMPGMSNGIAGQ